MVTPRISETSGRVPCLLCGIFMFVFMAHLFFLLKISCAFLEVGEGGSEAEKLFQHPAYRSAQWTGVLTYGRFEPWLFHAHFWMSSLTCSSPGPSCFNGRKAGQSHPLILETPSGWPGKFPSSRWHRTEFMAHRKSEHLFLWVYVMSFVLKHPQPPTHTDQILNLEGKNEKGNSY